MISLLLPRLGAKFTLLLAALRGEQQAELISTQRKAASKISRLRSLALRAVDIARPASFDGLSGFRRTVRFVRFLPNVRGRAGERFFRRFAQSDPRTTLGGLF